MHIMFTLCPPFIVHNMQHAIKQHFILIHHLMCLSLYSLWSSDNKKLVSSLDSFAATFAHGSTPTHFLTTELLPPIFNKGFTPTHFWRTHFHPFFTPELLPPIFDGPAPTHCWQRTRSHPLLTTDPLPPILDHELAPTYFWQQTRLNPLLTTPNHYCLTTDLLPPVFDHWSTRTTYPLPSIFDHGPSPTHVWLRTRSHPFLTTPIDLCPTTDILSPIFATDLLVHIICVVHTPTWFYPPTYFNLFLRPPAYLRPLTYF